MYSVYILRCRDGTLYTGIARDVAARMLRHEAGRGSRYVRARKASKIVYTEKQATVGDALRREREIKGWRRDKKLALIAHPPL